MFFAPMNQRAIQQELMSLPKNERRRAVALDILLKIAFLLVLITIGSFS